MTNRAFATLFLLALTSFTVPAAPREKSELEAIYDKAFSAFDAERYDDALKALDEIDARQPNLAESLNLRGVVLMRQGKFDKAERALRKAVSLEPRFWNASFNLAEIPFMKKDWGEARNRFEGLMSGQSDGMQPETNQLIQYKILLTFVRQGKENTVDWMLNKFEQAKDSPALYYSNAAIAFQRGNEKEARDWLDAAKKKYAAPLNKLYSESLYEIGWMQKPAGESRAALQITSAAEREERMKGDAKANFEKAERAFQQRDFTTALQLLDHADEASPNEPAFANLRGEILMEQKKFDEAETVLRKAVAADPKFREAQYNLAQIPFRQGQYAKARERLENLFSAMPGDEKDQAAQLIKFKIFMTLLLEGREAQAQQLMDQFKFTGDTPALYYAQSAWEFKHGHKEQGEDWVTSARKIYSPALNVIFADAFAGLGWLGSSENGTGPATSALALANSSPAAEATPTMRLGQAESLPAPEVETQGQAVATETPTSSQAPTPAAPIVAAKPTAQPAAPVVAKTSPTVETRPASSPAATIVASTQKRSTAKPTLAERVESVSNPRTFFVGGLLLAGILLLAALVVQQFRRSFFTTPLFKSATPLTDPPFSEDQSAIADESTAPSGGLIASGPPKLSLNLKASEPSVRAAVLPSGAITARGIAPGVDEPAAASPNEIDEFVSEAVPATLQEQKIPAVAEEPTMRDVQEISMPAAAIEATAEEPSVAAPASASALEIPALEAPVAAAPAVEMPADEPPIAAGPEAGLIAAPIAPAPAAETPVIEIPATELPAQGTVPAFAAMAHLVEQPAAPEPATEALSEPVILEEEPVGQGEPVPELTTALVAEPVISELTQPEPESNLVLIEPEETVAAPIAARETVQSSIETPAFASKILSTEPTRLQPTTPYHMPETTITPVAPAARPSASTMSVQQPAGGMHTAVQLTFSLEIASMQLTPTFKMSGLQLKPTSKVVSMRLAPSQDPQPPMNLQVTFEVAQIDLSGGTIGTVRLSPSGREKPAVLSSPSFAISGLELVSGAGAAPVQLTPLHQEQASVHLTAHFQIAAIEFTPMFEIAAIVLNATSRDVFMQLPGSGPTSIDSAPVFKMENVQLNGTDIGLIQVVPAVASLHG
jgi:predicted Zn-dependent protease